MPTHGTELIRATAKGAFWQAYERQPDIMGDITYRVTDSDSDQETYPFTSAAPSPIEMQGSRTHKSVPEISYTIKNKKWESTVDISYEMVRFEKLAQIESLSGELGMKARMYPNKLIADLMRTGDATAGHDGQYFFSAAHVDAGAAYSTAQDNDLTDDIVAETAPTDIEWATMIRAMLDAIRGFKDGQGDPVVPAPDTVFEVHVASGYLSVSNRVEKADQLTGPVGNDVKGLYRTVHNPWLDAVGTTAEFFMFNPSGIRKPFVLQEADPVTMEDNIGDESEKETKDRWIGSFGYYNVGYGDWRYAVRMAVTTT